MMDTGSSTFLQQAQRNNWQRYLASLQQGSAVGFDVCVLTASDERQAAMYRRQLDWRREAGLLPTRTRFLVIPDPAGRRIGSGGATLHALAQVADWAAVTNDGEPASSTLRLERLLIIHSGGDSKRLPHCSAIGKLFARVPRTLPDGRTSTIFDEFLISLSALSAELPPGVLISSGDVLLIFDHLQLSCRRPGVIGVAAAAPADMGRRHGVYAAAEGGHRVRAYLHKPSAAELAHWDAISPDGTVQIDTGLVWLDAATAAKWLALAHETPVAGLCGPQATAGLNLYGDLLLPLAGSTTFEGYLADESDGPATPAVQAARRVIWERLRGAVFSVERLQPAVFVHFGSTAEYWRMAAGDDALARLCGWDGVGAGAGVQGCRGAQEQLVLINAAIGAEVAPPPSPPPARERERVLVTDSLLGGLTWAGAALVAEVQTAQPVALAADVALHQLPIAGGGYVTRIFGLYDDPKQPWDAPRATFLNQAWPVWLAQAGLTPAQVWPDAAPDGRTLWNARLYPLAVDREESLRLALPLQVPEAADAGWRTRWLAAPRLSLGESFVRADGERELAELADVEDQVAARRFYAAVVAERPAAQVAGLLGTATGQAARRGELVGAWLAAGAPILRLRGYKAIAEATQEPAWEDRAFETLAAMIEAATPSLQETPTGSVSARPERERRRVRVAAAARIDFGGGWTDTPPYSLERGGTVLNAAVTLRGRHPIVAEAELLPEPRLVLESRDIDAAIEPAHAGEVLAYADPTDPFALLKAALVLRGIVPASCDPATPIGDLLAERGGLRLSTETAIPRGSGLGTSSIMAGAVLECLARLLNRTEDRRRGTADPASVFHLPSSILFDEVLCLEQMLTTGGGWQDQVGGLTGGIKLVTTRPGLPQQIHVEPVQLEPATAAGLRDRLLLVYTGQQRLAKNLLRAMMGRWMARDPEMVWLQAEIARLAVAMREALYAGDLDTFGALLGEHWVLNKRMDPGCTNPFIDDLFATMRPYVNGGKLAGAGGGGYAMVIARSRAASHDLAAALAGRYAGTPVGVWESGVPGEGILIAHTLPDDTPPGC
ncbi:MAG: hypothetical protein NT169_19205 [Chloroflexi bacterium]|nr:hypothetical protein [Chloroflexota bacterium]